MLRPRWLVVLMVLAVGAVASLAYWEEARESAAALETFGRSQVTLAEGVAAELQGRLPAGAASAADALLEELRVVTRGGKLRVFILSPAAGRLQSAEGPLSPRAAAPLLAGLARGRSVFRLSRPEAAALGLPERTAMVGVARAQSPAGPWSVVVAASAERERDRQQRALRRLLRSVLLAAGLVASFGGLAVWTLRKELALAESLEAERLSRLSRAATTLTLASGFAHELGTPLAVIAGRAEQLQSRTGADERAGRAAATILEQTFRIQELVRSFLHLARGGAPAFEPTEPERILRRALSLVEHRYAQAHVRLGAEGGPPLPPLVCDARLLEQALVNLLLNACDASPAGGLVQARLEPEGNSLTFSVTDEGPGISPADAARVLEPFFTTKPEGQGTGLGLAIASEIMKIHHGSLRLEPAPGGGTRARLTLPLTPGGLHAEA